MLVDITTCPTCGSTVKQVTGSENTSHFEPLPVRAVAGGQENLVVLIIPPGAQASTRFDQHKLGVVSAVTDANGASWVTIDPEVFSRVFPKEVV